MTQAHTPNSDKMTPEQILTIARETRRAGLRIVSGAHYVASEGIAVLVCEKRAYHPSWATTRYSTHEWNEWTGCYSGHYDLTLTQAAQDFASRVAKLRGLTVYAQAEKYDVSGLPTNERDDAELRARRLAASEKRVVYVVVKETGARRLGFKYVTQFAMPRDAGSVVYTASPGPKLPRDDDGQLTVYAWPGGYPVYFVTADGGTLCAECARRADDAGLTRDPDDAQWYIVAGDVNWEDTSLECDDCSERIASAYGDDDAEASEA